MSLNIASNGTTQCPYSHHLKSFGPRNISACSCGSSSVLKHVKRDQRNTFPLSLSSSFYYTSTKLLKLDKPVLRGRIIKRFCSAKLGEDFGEKSKEYKKKLAPTDVAKNDQGQGNIKTTFTISKAGPCGAEYQSNMCSENSFLPTKFKLLEPLMLGIRPDPPAWPEREAILRDVIERKADSAELPMSLRMIQKKQHLNEGSSDLEDPSCCSIHKAFSSVVSITLELQSYALQMTEAAYDEDLDGIRAKVQREIHLSFLWLFQQVLSQTPSLMIHVMIFFANFSLHAMDHGVVIPQPSSMGPLHATAKEKAMMAEERTQKHLQIDSPAFGKSSFPCSKGDGTEDEDINLRSSSLSIQYPDIVPKNISHVGSKELTNTMEVNMWNSIVDEAKRMHHGLENVVLDHEVMQGFVAPFSVELEAEDYTDYSKTDLLYQLSLLREPSNPLVLSNYAQFLLLVKHDYDRAEDCFKRAVQVKPTDAESLSQYANFLWMVRKDLWGAEERYIQAVEAEPNSPYHASQYANFLWNTGSEETYFPLKI